MQANRVYFSLIHEVSGKQTEFYLTLAIAAAESLRPIGDYDGPAIVKFDPYENRGVFDVTSPLGRDVMTVFKRYVEISHSPCAYSFRFSNSPNPESMALRPGERQLKYGEDWKSHP